MEWFLLIYFCHFSDYSMTTRKKWSVRGETEKQREYFPWKFMVLKRLSRVIQFAIIIMLDVPRVEILKNKLQSFFSSAKILVYENFFFVFLLVAFSFNLIWIWGESLWRGFNVCLKGEKNTRYLWGLVLN